jgi:cyclophilin family peptidyl-prolyl cis-trans isomerase/HEAT repeat protein
MEIVKSKRVSSSARSLFCIALLITLLSSAHEGSAQVSKAPAVPSDLLLRIVEAEDKRRWDESLRTLLISANPAVRRRAAFAAGRIGDEDAIGPLIEVLEKDSEQEVRAAAAFAIGEIESSTGRGADALIAVLGKSDQPAEVRAHSVEALGKIAGALPKAEAELSVRYGDAILAVLKAADGGPTQNQQVILRALTAALRARPAGAGPVVAKFLSHNNARIRADAANTLARLRATEGGPELRTLLSVDPEPVVRANAARALGGAEDKTAFDALLTAATTDADQRVRVSSIRSVAALKDARAVSPLVSRGESLLRQYQTVKRKGSARPSEINELLEIAIAFGRLTPGVSQDRVITFLRALRKETAGSAPEVEASFAVIAPDTYLNEFLTSPSRGKTFRFPAGTSWQTASAMSQGLVAAQLLDQSSSAGASTIEGPAAKLRLATQEALLELINSADLPSLALSDVLRAYAASKPARLREVLIQQLASNDVVTRATVVELLGELPQDEIITAALIGALPRAMHEKLNDAALSILDVLAKQKTPGANDAIQSALDSTDHLIRRRAASLLSANGAGDFSARIGVVQTTNTFADYKRAISRIGKTVRAEVSTDRGTFSLELLPGDAPLTVDNFVQLAGRGYFDGTTFHRVVPNFVVQGGDPRGDGNGGPGYQIRCEINEVAFDRGTVGMALSGKDTGGSQWFVTHSPQPHLDGGYTVFGRVVGGQDIVDRIARGDKIRKIRITEPDRPASKRRRA